MKKIVIPILSFLLLPGLVLAANDLTFDADTTINLSSSGINLTVISGSKVDEMTVNPSNVQFTLSSGGSLTLRSNDKYTLTNDLNVGISCTDSYSEIVVPGPSSGTTTITVTPSTDTCTAAGTGSPTGGGGGGAAPTPSPTVPSTTTGQVTVSPASGGKTTLTTAENATAAVEFPANAVSASTLVKITPFTKAGVTGSRPLPDGKNVVGGYAYNYTATRDGQDVTSFSKNITLTFTYTDSQVAGFEETTLRIYYWDEATAQWTSLTTTINTATNTLSVSIIHFTYYAILGEGEAVEEVEEVEEEVVTIADGNLIRNPNAEGLAQFDIYIVKLVGDKKFKRLILSPHVFESYEHLKWEDVQDVSQSVMDEYTISDLVRAEGDYKVYQLTPDGDTGTKQWLNMTIEGFVAQGYDWDAVYTINTTDRDAYTIGSEITLEGPAREEAETVTETIIIKVYALRVRSLPSLDGEILTFVHQGEIYELLDEQNGWYKITAGDVTGWCFGGETGGYAAKQ